MTIKRINFIHKDKSDIQYKVDRYPDGQIQLVIDLPDNKCHIDILVSIECSDDIFVLMQLSDIINRRQLTCSITIAYLLAARTDRLFSWNTSHTLKIVADVINSFNADKVRVLTPHSDMSLKLIKNSVAIEPFNYMLESGDYPFINSLIISPDAGAKDRLIRLMSDGYSFIQLRGLENPYAIKKRGPSGDIQSIELIGMADLECRTKVIVLDDLCDGGGTFIKLRPEISKYNPKEVNIMVTHAIQQKGIENLAEAYDNVYITNSYEDWNDFKFPDNVHVFDVIGRLENE